MGGRGSGGGNPVAVGKRVTVHHAVYGTVKGTVSRINSRGNFFLSNAHSTRTGKPVGSTVAFSPGDLMFTALGTNKG